MEHVETLFRLGQIILVDLVLAGDNAIVIGLVAAQFSAARRRKIIFYGIGAAVLLRIIFAVLTVQLLAIKGLLLVGGLLLLWICWKLWCDLRAPSNTAQNTPAESATKSATKSDAESATESDCERPLLASVMQVVIADLSMSLDNVLAVAGIAAGHTGLLIIGLAISVAFMIFAATMIAKLLTKHRWIGYLGLAVIIYVGMDMTWRGGVEVVKLIW